MSQDRAGRTGRGVGAPRPAAARVLPSRGAGAVAGRAGPAQRLLEVDDPPPAHHPAGRRVARTHADQHLPPDHPAVPDRVGARREPRRHPGRTTAAHPAVHRDRSDDVPRRRRRRATRSASSGSAWAPGSRSSSSRSAAPSRCTSALHPARCSPSTRPPCSRRPAGRAGRPHPGEPDHRARPPRRPRRHPGPGLRDLRRRQHRRGRGHRGTGLRPRRAGGRRDQPRGDPRRRHPAPARPRRALLGTASAMSARLGSLAAASDATSALPSAPRCERPRQPASVLRLADVRRPHGHGVDLHQLGGQPEDRRTASNVPGASCSPNRRRTTSHAAARSSRDVVAT